MKIKITDAPLGHKFDPDKSYLVHGTHGYAFVFDDDCESCFLTDLEWEILENED